MLQADRCTGPAIVEEVTMVVAATSYPLLDAMWTIIVFFAWVIWFWMLIVVFSDLFRRDDISGWGKAGWFAALLVLPYAGVLIYLIAQGKQMAARRRRDALESKAQFDAYVRDVAGTYPNGHGGATPAEEIGRGKQLLDSGAITSEEYDALKRKVLAG